ncbi:MAG TPA: exosortase/archaeosortase family protein [Planctomycetota bacterium]|nr:exosortase/archaeosortase family protein [Planctomycetota bacterium]
MDKIAALLDGVFIVVFGAWAYVVAKRKRRDEVGWLLIAAVAFWLPGYLMQDVLFPLLAKHLGWTPECQETWRKPSAFIVGGLCALLVDLYLTLFVKPLPPAPEAGGGAPPAAGAGPTPPPGEGGEAQPPAAGDEGAAAQEMGAPAPAAGPDLRAEGPLDYLARYWPTGIIVLMYLLPTLDAFEPIMPRLGFTRVHGGPYPPYRELAASLLVGVQVWLWGRRLAPALLCALFCAAFIPEMNWMEWQWSRGSSYYSHGYLVPFVTLWLVWMNRQRLAKLEPKGDLCGVGLLTLGFGLLLLLAGAYLRMGSIQGASFLVVLCGLVFFLYGRAISRVLLFPLLFTASMIPLSMWALDAFTFPLKMFATAGTVQVVNGLHTAGMHPHRVAQEGNEVTWRLADGTKDKLTVAEACSGLKSLIALLTFGALLAYLAKLSRRHKLVLFLAGIPVALLANMWRIITLVLLAGRWGSKVAQPDHFVHDATGLGIFVVAFILFFTFERVLQRFEPGGAEAEPQDLGPLVAASP